MGGGSSPPPPPDPYKVADAQEKANKKTAEFQAGINRANQYTPQGSVEWEMIGRWPDGSPRYRSTQQYSPDEQNIYNLNTQARGNVGQIAVDQTGRIQDHLGTPLDLSNENVTSYLFDLGRKRLDPMFAEKRQSLEQSLANKGIGMGTDAYHRAMRGIDQSENDAFNQLQLAGRAQAVQELLTSRNQPINETTALMSGSQVSQPSFIGNPQTGVANTDVAGIHQNAYNQQLAAWNADQQQGNAMMGGLFGLGSAALRFLPFSDRRLKTDIRRIGWADNGQPIYLYRMKDGGPFQIGFMADQVKKSRPDAVVRHPSGFDMVDYQKAAA